MSEANVEVVRALIPPPDVDIAPLVRDDRLFEATTETLASVLHWELESVAVWQGGTTYSGVQGFREMWLDWLQPYMAYYTQVDEMIDVGDRVVVFARDRGRLHDTDSEVDLMAGSVWELRDGRIVRVEFCANREQALEAAGLSE
jgi:ketosteroid isomerase-like protein